MDETRTHLFFIFFLERRVYTSEKKAFEIPDSAALKSKSRLLHHKKLKNLRPNFAKKSLPNEHGIINLASSLNNLKKTTIRCNLFESTSLHGSIYLEGEWKISRNLCLDNYHMYYKSCCMYSLLIYSSYAWNVGFKFHGCLSIYLKARIPALLA